MNTVGYAVGDWNSGKKVYPNLEYLNGGYSNLGGRGGFNTSDKIYPFYQDRLNMRTSVSTLGISWSKLRERKQIVDDFKNKGLNILQINEYFRTFQLRGGSKTDTDGFVSYLNDQLLLQTAKEKEEEELLEKLKEEEKQKEISDLNLFPPKVDEPKNDTSTMPKDFVEESKPNYLLYGGIGIAVLVGGYLIFKRK